MELEDTMASLVLSDRVCESLDAEETEEEEPESDEESLPLRRSSRLRSRSHPLPAEKRRVLTKPIKISKDGNLGNVENYYLDKRVKRLHPSLETIYEESRQARNQEVFMSSKKFQRRINFNLAAKNNGGKIRKRMMKAKHLTATNRVANKKITLKFLMEKLSNIKDED